MCNEWRNIRWFWVHLSLSILLNCNFLKLIVGGSWVLTFFFIEYCKKLVWVIFLTFFYILLLFVSPLLFCTFLPHFFLLSIHLLFCTILIYVLSVYLIPSFCVLFSVVSFISCRFFYFLSFLKFHWRYK